MKDETLLAPWSGVSIWGKEGKWMGMVSAGQRVASRDGVLTASIVKTRCSMFRMTSTLINEHISQHWSDRQVKRHMLGSSHKVDRAIP